MNIINFGAGPCQLSKDLLKTTRDDIINYKETGISIYELSHHTDMWTELYSETVNNAKNFLEIPNTHECFFMNGGGTHQFPTIYYNLCNSESKVQVLVSGFWSQKAVNEFKKFCKEFLHSVYPVRLDAMSLSVLRFSDIFSLAC